MALRFDPQTRPRRYLARREQRRVLLYVLLLGGVVILAQQAILPEHRTFWAAFVASAARNDADDAAQADASGDGGAVDTRLIQAPRRSRPIAGQVQILPATEDGGGENEDVDEDAVIDADKDAEINLDKDSVGGDGDRGAAQQRDPDSGFSYFPGVKPVYLDAVKDNTFPLSRENEAKFHLFDVLQNSEAAEIDAGSQAVVTFRQLFSQPNVYRGRLVTMRGTVKRAFRRTAPKNIYGIETYYELWFWPSDANPVIVHCLGLPDEFPMNRQPDAAANNAEQPPIKNLNERITVTGFFFKKQAYEAMQGDAMISPLVLAKTPVWKKRPVVVEPLPTGVEFAIVGGIAAFFAIGITMFIWYRTRRPGRFADAGESAAKSKFMSEIERHAARDRQ